MGLLMEGVGGALEGRWRSVGWDVILLLGNLAE